MKNVGKKTSKRREKTAGAEVQGEEEGTKKKRAAFALLRHDPKCNIPQYEKSMFPGLVFFSWQGQ